MDTLTFVRIICCLLYVAILFALAKGIKIAWKTKQKDMIVVGIILFITSLILFYVTIPK